jgi:hypothetical protein
VVRKPHTKRPTRKTRDLQIAEACAQVMFRIAGDIGSRTKVGLALGEAGEAIRNGEWRKEM